MGFLGYPDPRQLGIPLGFTQALAQAQLSGPVYFTIKGEQVYAIYWGQPEKEVLLKDIWLKPRSEVKMLGVEGKLKWKQRGDHVHIEIPTELPSRYAVSFIMQPDQKQ